MSIKAQLYYIFPYHHGLKEPTLPANFEHETQNQKCAIITNIVLQYFLDIKPGDVIETSITISNDPRLRNLGKYIWDGHAAETLDYHYEGGAVPMKYICDPSKNVFTPVFWREVISYNMITWPDIKVRVFIASHLQETHIEDEGTTFTAAQLDIFHRRYDFRVDAVDLADARLAVLNMLKPFNIYREERDPRMPGGSIITLSVEADPWGNYPNY